MKSKRDEDAVAKECVPVETNTADDDEPIGGIEFVDYVDERQLDDVMRLVGKDLSEPYSVFTYRYFLDQWPELCILAVPKGERRPIGCVVCKIDMGDDDVGSGNTSAVDSETIPTGEQGGDDDDAGSPQQRRKFRQFPGGTGYIGMLAVDTTCRRGGIGTMLAQRAIQRMRAMSCESVRLEAEVSNHAAMRLYEDRLGFSREELLVTYYLNWGDAYRLRLWFD